LIGTPADLLSSATRRCGLSDFGPDDFSDGLAVLLSSFASDAGLTEAGSRAARAQVRGALIARLLSEAGFAANPSHASVEITRPVFVTGLPRTGTTYLHRLLVADPGAQGLELWLAEAPQPRPDRALWPSNPAYQVIADGIARHRESHPTFGTVHEMAADQVEECWQLLRQSMRSVAFECLAYLPTYSSWLAGQDWTPVYQRYRRNLQLLGLWAQDRRWVLKNPSHLFALDALMSVYPDALVVVTHREPRVAIASLCSLAAQASGHWSTAFQGPVIGQSQLSLWAHGLELFNAARARYPAAQFLDVAYDDLVADPLAVVSQVYTALGTTLSPPAADAMRPLIPSTSTAPAAGAGAASAAGAGAASSPGAGAGAAAGAGAGAAVSAGAGAAVSAGAGAGAGGSGNGARPAHRYTLADFGLTAEQVDERFATLTP
jgi:Sulfotransferase family